MKKNLLLALSILLISQFTYSQTNKTEVYILGTLHSNHLISDFNYSFSDLEQIIQSIQPDLIGIEMTPEALDKALEGYFPPENTVVIEFAKKQGINICPIDWRYALDEASKAPKTLTKEEQNSIKLAQKKVEELAIQYLIAQQWKGYFNFVQNNAEFHQAIKLQHDTKIALLGEAQDGYWLSRNEKIVQKLIKAIEDNKSKKVLVSIGLHHKYILEELLADKPNIEIKTIPTYQTSNNTELSPEVIARWQHNKAQLEQLLTDRTTSDPLKQKIKQSGRIKALENLIQTKGVANKQIRHFFEK